MEGLSNLCIMYTFPHCFFDKLKRQKYAAQRILFIFIIFSMQNMNYTIQKLQFIKKLKFSYCNKI